VERWYVYPVNEDTIYRIRGNQTDQLVSRDHNCLVERDGKLTFVKSQDLGDMERVPILQNDFSFLQEGELQVLQSPMQWQSEGGRMERVGEDRRRDFQSSSEQNEESKLRRKKWSVERWNNLQKQEGLLLKSKNKIREVSRRIQKYGKERWIRNGIQVESSTGIEETFVENGMCTSYRPQSRKQRYTKSNVIQEQLRPQEIRSGTSYTTDMATITKETYSGIIFCPNISTGAFVARRNGKVFITGNSGFPKSHNIGKAVEKLNGDVKVIGKKKGAGSTGKSYVGNNEEYVGGDTGVFKKEYDEIEINNQYEGWGTALKPAHEPIVMARKPLSEKTVVDNVLEWGTGGINIDDSRVAFKDGADKKESTQKNQHADFGTKPLTGNVIYGDYSMVEPKNYNPPGRFPANLIFDEEAGKILDKQSGISKTGDIKPYKENTKSSIHGDDRFFKSREVRTTYFAGDTGGASRFFYCPKTSKTDRNEGLEDFEDKQSVRHIRQNVGRKDAGSMVSSEPRKNNHPTVKPTDLMLYLIRLVTPKGGTTLDPFMGSGSTGKAAVRGGFDFIGIEREQEYMDIAKARIDYEQKNPYIEETGKRVETNENSQKFW